jgi:hypothetical protein
LGIEQLNYRATPALLTLMLAVVAALAVLALPAPVSAERPTAPVWSLVVTRAPGCRKTFGSPRTATTRMDGRRGGCLCLGPLAQGLGPTQHATVLVDVYSAGIFGIDGTPDAPGTYNSPRANSSRTGASAPRKCSSPAITPSPRRDLLHRL